MTKEYKIVGLANNQITLEYDGITRNFPLPIHDGLYPEGDELEALLTRYVEIQREIANPVIPAASNEGIIKSLVESSTVTDTKVKQQRNRLLNQTDKFVLPDAPTANLEAWKIYRQALRDITIHTDFPIVTWPVPPVQLKTITGTNLTNEDGSPTQ